LKPLLFTSSALSFHFTFPSLYSSHNLCATMSNIAILNSTPIAQAPEKSADVEETEMKAPVENGVSHAHSSGKDLDEAHDTAGVCPFRPPPLNGMKIYAEAKTELELIRSAHRTLAPTGCTPDFCQSGRMTRINEPRVGRDRPLAEIQQEAVDFLKECHDYGVIKSNEDLDKRIREALVQISNTAIFSTITDRDGNISEGLAGGSWYQHPAELEYGLRAAWRNARRCIMRSEHEHLVLCDLRRVQSSREMARTIAKGMQEAFNRGHIIPTVFAFPPRQPGKRGPMVWNHQMMAFAGYLEADGSILGDPANVDLTQSMIDFGWKPPINKSRWDLLPLITMAENDAPYMMELPSELKRTVQITHPRYEKEFRDLDLRWVLAPALSRLGFDIGGNQYTATPFIGWFMDSEIGVRDLADTFRYNALPDVVNALGLSPEPETPLEDLPEYMHLVALVSIRIYNALGNTDIHLVQSSSRVELCSLLLLPPRSCDDD
jgi:nitric oxide synthase oxygenase domain/subunit